jgi:hypothetical protein
MCLLKTGERSFVECSKHAAELGGLLASNRYFRESESERKAVLHYAC